jgi:hypothetical protein
VEQDASTGAALDVLVGGGDAVERQASDDGDGG